MLDVNFILQNKDLVKRSCKLRQIEIDIDFIINLLKNRKNLIKQKNELRKNLNKLSSVIPNSSKKEELINQASRIKQKVKSIEQKLKDLEKQIFPLLLKIPNLISKDVPIGNSEEDNKEIKRIGKIPTFDFRPKDHLSLTKDLDLVDFERASKVVGNKFYYLKNQAVKLHFALLNYALDILIKEGFTPIITPDLSRFEVIEGAGYNPRGKETQIYVLKDFDLGLIGTAEITLAGYLKDEILKEADLPIKFVGYSHCFRTEAGSYGKMSKGLYRVHQFGKIEMFIFCKPEESDKMLDYLVRLEEKIFSSLELPLRIINCCTAELGAPAYKKFDIECYIPSEKKWGEITSASNCTDYQARRLNIKFRRDSTGKLEYVHTLNGTGLANVRTLMMIFENHQQKNGTIKIPEKLVKYTGFKEIKKL